MQDTRPRFSWRAALARSAGAGVALVATGLILRAALSTSMPPELLSDRFTLILPIGVFDFLISSLEYWGKSFLFLGLLTLWFLLGTALGLLTGYIAWRQTGSVRPESGLSALGRSVVLSLSFGLVPWLLGALVIAPASGAGLLGLDVMSGPVRFAGALFLSCLAFCLALYYLVAEPLFARTDTSQGPGGLWGLRLGRREFLSWAALGALSLVAGSLLYRTVTGFIPEAARAALRTSLGQLVSEVTPTNQFYIVSKNFDDPVLTEADWRLEITGLVGKPRTYTFEEFRALPSVEEFVTLECISNEVGGNLMSNALWTGVPLREVLARAEAGPGVLDVATHGADGYSESLDIESAMRDEVLLAYQMNGELLTSLHGFPVRLLIPGRYGMKSTKWVEKIELVAEEHRGYYEQRDWDRKGVVKTTSRVDVPAKRAQLPLGPLTIAGVAYSGSRGISKVEVSVDEGKSWQEATVREALSPYTWQLWGLEWEPEGEGKRQVWVRAADGTGEVQTAEVAPPAPSGATGYHKIDVELVS